MDTAPAPVGFSLGAKKPQRKLSVHDQQQEHHKEAVLGFGDGGLQTAEPSGSSQCKKVIPKLENTYRSGPKKFKPSFVPEATDVEKLEGDIDKFETAAHDTAVAQQDVVYGLIKRQRPEQAQEAEPDQGGAAPAAAHGDREREALKQDLETLPPVASLEAYEAMPVEAFGEALMRGMGWTEGRSIGRGSKAEVTAKELVRRPARLGLGAAPAPEANTKRFIKPGESREKQDLVYVDAATGRVSNSRPVGAALVARPAQGVAPGRRMRVAAGRHEGLACEVVELERREEGRSERARVRLPSLEVVSVRVKELAELDARRDSSRRDERRDTERPSTSRASGREERRGEGGRPSREREPEPPREEGPAWLAPNIRVKIVDKKASGGRLYLKKGVVVDVKAPTLCDVLLDDGRKPATDLRQWQLETVVPGTEGTPVLVVLGQLRGRRGRLLKRNTETGLAAVQLAGDLSLHRLPLEAVCEYAGPADTWDE